MKLGFPTSIIFVPVDIIVVLVVLVVVDVIEVEAFVVVVDAVLIVAVVVVDVLLIVLVETTIPKWKHFLASKIIDSNLQILQLEHQ